MQRHAFSFIAAALFACLPVATKAQTQPAAGWQAHTSACLPNQANGSTHLNNIPEGPGSVRFTHTQPGPFSNTTEIWRLAAWRVDCPNDPQFPLFAIRVLSAQTNAASFRTPGLLFPNLGTVVQQGASTLFRSGWDQSGFSNGLRVGTSGLSPAGGYTAVLAITDNPGFVFRDAFSIEGANLSETLRFAAVGNPATGGPRPAGGRLSGTYFDPARSGEGIMVDFASLEAGQPHAFLSWYTYDDAGNLLWVVGNTVYAEGATSVTVPLAQTSGGRWGPALRPENLSRTAWGQATLSFPDCRTAVMQWTRFATGERGTYRMTRVGIAPVGLGC